VATARASGSLYSAAAAALSADAAAAAALAARAANSSSLATSAAAAAAAAASRSRRWRSAMWGEGDPTRRLVGNHAGRAEAPLVGLAWLPPLPRVAGLLRAVAADGMEAGAAPARCTSSRSAVERRTRGSPNSAIRVASSKGVGGPRCRGGEGEPSSEGSPVMLSSACGLPAGGRAHVAGDPSGEHTGAAPEHSRGGVGERTRGDEAEAVGRGGVAGEAVERSAERRAGAAPDKAAPADGLR